MHKSHPTHLGVAVQASGGITDPEFEVIQSIFSQDDLAKDKPKVVPIDTRLDLFNGSVILYFTGSKFIPFLPEPHDRFPYYQLLYFLIYRSRVNYNIVWPDRGRELPSIEPTSEVAFSLGRLVRVERDEMIGGKHHILWHYETEPHAVTVTRQELEDLLTICTPQLYLALAYYLIGCENVRYFLIEFYKAVEVIENALGGERQAISKLEPYGVVGAEFKRLKRYASDQQRPFDIGRHAPKGTDLQVIDIRRLLEEPLSHKVFTESVSTIRQVIDAYFSLLRSRR